MSVLAKAHQEWATRPADESYLTVEEWHDAITSRDSRTIHVDSDYGQIIPEIVDGEVGLVSTVSSDRVQFNHWSFGQFADKVGAPPNYLRRLSPELAVQNLQYLWGNLLEDKQNKGLQISLLNSEDELEVPKVRAFLSDRYARINDRDIAMKVRSLGEMGWQPAPATELANGGVTRGLYASDRDIFAFLVDNNRRIFEKDPNGGLSRGFMVSNSEVGSKSFHLLTFLYSYICGNHNVWGVESVAEARVRHIGEAAAKGHQELEVYIKHYAEGSAKEDEYRIQRCMTHLLAETKEDLVSQLFNLKSLGLSKKLINAAYDAAESHEDWYGAPLSAWGFGNGLTHVAREIIHMDERIGVEKAAGKIFEMAA
jgi:hypothetical protein